MVGIIPSSPTAVGNTAEHCMHQDHKIPIPDEHTSPIDEKRKSTHKAPFTVPEPAPKYSRHEDPEPALPTVVTEPVYITRHRGVSTLIFYTVAAALVLSILINVFYTGIAMKGFLGSLRHSPWDVSPPVNIQPVINIGDAATPGISKEIVQSGATVTLSSAPQTLTTTLLSTTTASGSTSVTTATDTTTVVKVNVVQTNLIVNSTPGPVVKSTSTVVVAPSSVG